MKKIISLLLALCMLIGTLTALPVFADQNDPDEAAASDETIGEENGGEQEEEPGKEPAEQTDGDTSENPEDKPEEGSEEEPSEDEGVDYMNVVYGTKEEKLAAMTLMTERYGFKLYYEPVTGEVAVVNVTTGDTFFTNPYDINSPAKIGDTQLKLSDSTKEALYSQIMIDYLDNTGKTFSMNSYVEAASRGQIKLKRIKNGIRVEYIMGKQESRSLVPRLITRDRLEEQILNKISSVRDDESLPQAQRDEADQKYKKIEAYFTLLDPNDGGIASSVVESMQSKYPITAKTYTDTDGSTKFYSVYYFNEESPSAGELGTLESIMNQYAPQYDYEQLTYDHEFTGYKSSASNPVQFRLALEYTLDEAGLSVRLPANGIRFDQTAYNLEKITVLPYAGAGSVEYTGYAFIPDGSGTLIRFEDTLKNNVTAMISGSLYGNDYTYHTLSTSNNQQVMRMPIFGIVEDTEKDGVLRKSGYLAIIEEGDSLATITAQNGMRYRNTSKYNTVYTSLNPRPKDSYDLSSAISVSGNTTCTVVSERKYTGNYIVRYIMLTDVEYAEKNGIDSTGCFDASYIGMAEAYRSRLEKSGALRKLIDDKKDIPLYIETLGVMDVVESFLSIPVTVKRELTSFDDIKTITNELGENGINNIVYKLTGYTNGGMVNTLANRVKIEKSAGGEEGFKKLLEYASEKGIGVYLDSDFTYAKTESAFDGFDRKKQAVKTIDNRYTRKRVYSAILQSFTNTSLVAISPSVFTDIFREAEKDMEKLGITSISLGAIGSDLNSDFDEDDPYNREDSKENVIKTLSRIKENGYSVMMDGGNSYAVAYADHVLNVALDSSNMRSASEAIPMFGLVYHGYLNFAGSPTNMSGDIRYETLKILENGADPYFILVYRNAEKLKEDEELSSYFSISYENWKEDLIETYKNLNIALSPVKDSVIKDHEFIIGERIPSEDELEADRIAAEKAAEDAARAEEERLAEEERIKNHEQHLRDKGVTVIPVTDVTDDSKENEKENVGGEGTEGENRDGEITENENPEENPEEEKPEEEKPVEEDIGTDEGENSGTNRRRDGYEYTKYTTDNGIVKVTFENGYVYILNYNIFDVRTEETGDTAIGSLGYIVLSPDGSTVFNSREEAAAR